MGSIDSMYSNRRSGVCEIFPVTPKPSLLPVSQRVQGRRKVRKAAGSEANLLCGKSVICGFCLVRQTLKGKGKGKDKRGINGYWRHLGVFW